MCFMSSLPRLVVTSGRLGTSPFLWALTKSPILLSCTVTPNRPIFRPDPQLKSEIRKEFKLQRISSEWMK